jgi:DNA invertase Pin-like site-specific DNA recombinase
MTTKHAAIYSRVSSKRQDTRSQEPDLSNWVMSQNAPVERYGDKFTGRTMDRPGWQKLWRAVEEGKISTIVVWRLDRLGRTAAGLTKLFADLRKRGVNLISLKDGFDLKTPAGRLMATFLAGAAEYDNEIRTERVLAGQAVARANGKTWGGWARGRRRKVTQEQLAVVRQMKAAGERIAAIARATGLSRPSVYAVLNSGLVRIDARENHD